jgi:hypothetical protein
VVILAVGRNITNNIARKINIDATSGRASVKSLADYDGYSSVTIEVDPAQAQMVAAISVGGANKMILTLRNNDDTDRTNLMAVRASDAIYNEVRAPASAQPAGNSGNGGAR